MKPGDLVKYRGRTIFVVAYADAEGNRCTKREYEYSDRIGWLVGAEVDATNTTIYDPRHCEVISEGR